MGKVDLDIALYMKSLSGDNFMLEANFEDDDHKTCSVKFQVNVVRNEDDTM